jgi:hypothetical protein
MQQGFSSCLLFFVDPLEFERIKPDTAAAPLTNVNAEAADLRLSQLIVTGRAFHE